MKAGNFVPSNISVAVEVPEKYIEAANLMLAMFVPLVTPQPFIKKYFLAAIGLDVVNPVSTVTP